MSNSLGRAFNILYILGAGASANALPIVTDRKDENEVIHKSLIRELTIFCDSVKEHSGFAKYYRLCIAAQDFLTPDTFAKFLFVNENHTDYSDFKTLLSAYFFFKERVENTTIPCVDKRMLSFLATLCEAGNAFPNNVKILSWNYDNQFYLALEKFGVIPTDPNHIGNLKAFPFTQDSTQDKGNISLIHLNGIAGYSFFDHSGSILDKRRLHSDHNQDILGKLKALDRQSQIIRLLRDFDSPAERLLISFAWEKESISHSNAHFVSQRLAHAKALARAADILVVIGYSFPFLIEKLIRQYLKK